jgi:type I restriction enzyme S subunit
VLAAYDELIENNTRRIKLLEQMAQALYREWFVRPCQAGKLPKGWERKQIGDVATLLRGKSYRSEDLADDGSLPFLNLKCMERDGGFRHEGIKRFRGDYKDNHTAKAGDIVVAVTDMTQERRIVARAARVPRTHEPLYVMSMDLVRLAPKPGIPDAYLYAMLRYSKFPDEVKQHANGVNVLHLSPDRIAQFEFELPDKARREQFGEVAQSIFEQCDVLNLKNANLRRTRDLLLPKLISGEVSL